MDYRIEKFDSNSESVTHFSEMTNQLYQNDPFYIPPKVTATADAQYFLVMQNGKSVARAAAMINDDIRHNDLKTGLIGYYEAFEDTAAVEILFKEIEKYFKSQNCQYIIGPMNGSTWNKYRVTIPDSHPPFFLDNYNKPWYPDQFTANGFETIAKYYSSKQQPAESKRIQKFKDRFSKKGIRIRPIQDFRKDLMQIYEMSRIGFSNNYLYTPINAEQFLQMYTPIEKYIDPNYVLLAEDPDGRVVGFVFAVPNIFSQNTKSLIIKTLAVLPETSQRGLGSLLVEMLHDQAIKDGYQEVVHALMYEQNRSTNILSGKEEHFRNYHLYGKQI